MADTEQILTAKTILTMAEDQPQAKAVAVRGDRIVAVGTVADCEAALPGAQLVDLGDTVLMPGFVEAHSHPVLGGITYFAPATYVGPFEVPTWDDVVAVFRDKHANTPPQEALLFFGLDQLLHGCPAPTRHDLDEIFGERLVAVINNSGHAAYCTTATVNAAGITRDTPDPVGANYGHDPDGEPNGQAIEVAAVSVMTAPVMAATPSNPLVQTLQEYSKLSRRGITTASEMAYADEYRPPYVFAASLPGCPIRIALYHQSVESTAGATFESTAPKDMLYKPGIKLWADGSPWMGNIAISFDYLHNEQTERAGIVKRHTNPMDNMNYSREQLDTVLDTYAPQGWQMAIHCNGDVATDIVLDAFEAALDRHGLAGTDHRWRLEHLHTTTRKQMQRIASLGLTASLFPASLYWWGELLDGTMFEHEIGANWQKLGSAVDSGLRISLHNDGFATPPNPLGNVQVAVTRRAHDGAVHGEGEAISLDVALRAITINPAWQLFRENDIGSIEPGKLADFVELSKDPYEADIEHLTDEVQVLGTWVGGQRVDLDQLMAVGTPAAEQLVAQLAASK